MDSDDWIEKDMCEKLYTYIQERKDYEIIIYNCYVEYPGKTIKNNFYPKERLLTSKDIEQLQLQNIEKGIVKYYPPATNISVVWSKVYNKEFIQKNKLQLIPNIVRMPDALFNTEALEKAKKIYVYNEYLYHYQQNTFSICNRYSEKTVEYYEKYIKLVDEYIKKYKKSEEFKDTLNLKIITSIDIYMSNYFFNKDNPKSKNEIEKEFKELLQKDLYQKAFINVKKKYLSIYQKLVLYNAKKENIKVLKILNNIKRNLKKIKKLLK